MRELVKVFKALANENRIRILKMLEEKIMCVCEIREVLGVSQPSVSRHLNILKDVGLVNEIQEGIWINYQLSKFSQNKYSSIMLKHLEKWINQDEKVIKDKDEAKIINKKEVYKVT